MHIQQHASCLRGHSAQAVLDVTTRLGPALCGYPQTQQVPHQNSTLMTTAPHSSAMQKNSE